MNGIKKYLVGSPYFVEDVLGIDLYERARNGQLTHLLLNQPPVCDSYCRRCFMPNARRNEITDRLTLNESVKVIRDAAACGMFCLEISGEGEPLMSKSLRGIVQSAYDNGFTTTLITNAHLLTPDIIRFLFDRNVTLVVSLFSLRKDVYELDIGLRGSFEKTMAKIEDAACIYSGGTVTKDDKTIYRMAIHTTAQLDNVGELDNFKRFCAERSLFLSVAPLAAVGCGVDHQDLMLDPNQAWAAHQAGDNSIILSRSSKADVGRQVCGTCLYGLNLGFDGNLLFDVHSGYEIGGLLGNVRTNTIKELMAIQTKVAHELFASIDGYCPVRDPKWPAFLSSFLAAHQHDNRTPTPRFNRRRKTA